VLLALVAVVAVGGVVTLIFFTVLALTSARSLQGAVAGAQAQLMPAVEELMATAQEIAERAQRLRPPA
jgi:hypothetical protein